MDFSELLRAYHADPQSEILEELKRQARRIGPGAHMALLFDVGIYRGRCIKHPDYPIRKEYRFIFYFDDIQDEIDLLEYFEKYYGDVIYRRSGPRVDYSKGEDWKRVSLLKFEGSNVLLKVNVGAENVMVMISTIKEDLIKDPLLLAMIQSSHA